MIRRFLTRGFAWLAIIWFVAFLWFTIALPGPSADGKSAAVIVPTGAAGRIEHGLEVLAEGQAEIMLVTGVDPEVKSGEFAVQFDVPVDVMECCVKLGYRAADTRGNAAETADWIKQRKLKSLRLVTTDWHMRRAAFELRRAIPDDVIVIEDAVASEPSLRILFLEFHKWLASPLSGVWSA